MATLTVEKREQAGKYAAFDLRKQGYIPGVIYGKGVDNINVKMPLREFEHLLHAGDRIVDITMGDKKYKVILQDVQHGVFAHELLHADFRTISETESIHVNVGIELVGEAAGIEVGGVVEQSLFEVEIGCLPRNLPEKIELDISAMGVGDTFYVSNLPALEGVEYRTDAGIAVVNCHMPAGEEEPEEGGEGDAEGEASEPEVIGEKEREEKKEDEDKK